MKKYASYILVATCIGIIYLYFDLSNAIKRLDNNRAVVTNHWTGEVKRCVVIPGRDWACIPAESIPVPWYMAIVQHTFESFKN